MPDPETRTITVTLKEKDVNKIEEIIDKAVTDFIKELPRKIESKLESMVFQALGFTDQWGSKVEIDHCNGREPLVSQWINDRSKQVCHDVISGFNFVPSETAIKALKKEYAEKLQHAITHNMEDTARTAAEAVLKNIVSTDGLKMEVIKMVIDPKTASNPKHMAKMPTLRDMIYSDLVKGNGDAKAESDGE